MYLIFERGTKFNNCDESFPEFQQLLHRRSKYPNSWDFEKEYCRFFAAEERSADHALMRDASTEKLQTESSESDPNLSISKNCILSPRIDSVILLLTLLRESSVGGCRTFLNCTEIWVPKFPPAQTPVSA